MTRAQEEGPEVGGSEAGVRSFLGEVRPHYKGNWKSTEIRR